MCALFISSVISRANLKRHVEQHAIIIIRKSFSRGNNNKSPHVSYSPSSRAKALAKLRLNIVSRDVSSHSRRDKLILIAYINFFHCVRKTIRIHDAVGVAGVSRGDLRIFTIETGNPQKRIHWPLRTFATPGIPLIEQRASVATRLQRAGNAVQCTASC